MPELPEVEVLVQSLKPQLKNKSVRALRVLRPKMLNPTTPEQLASAVVSVRFIDISRRGKYLLFSIQSPLQSSPLQLVGHLGMTGRMYLLKTDVPWPKHTAVVMELERENFVFVDTRYFGRMTLDTTAIDKLGPEPFGKEFTVEYFTQALKRSAQPIKIKLLDQSLVAGIGNIYAAESLYRARVSPRLPASRLKTEQVGRLWQAIREILTEAINAGSTVRLDVAGTFGHAPSPGTAGEPGDFQTVQLSVYDHAGEPCPSCQTEIKRLVQAGRSTYFCPSCQRR